jgi:hypothetical protein
MDDNMNLMCGDWRLFPIQISAGTKAGPHLNSFRLEVLVKKCGH